LLQETQENIGKEVNAIGIKAEIDRAIEEVVKELKNIAKLINNKEKIR